MLTYIVLQKGQSRSTLVIFIYALLSLISDTLILFVFGKMPIERLNFFLNIDFSVFTVVEFTCFCLLFSYVLSNKQAVRFSNIVIYVFAPLSLLNYILIYSNGGKMDTIPVVFQAIVGMSLSIYFFLEQMRNPKTLFIYSTPAFWSVTSILIYLSGTFFVFLLSSNISQEELDMYWPINYFFNILKNLLFGVAVYLQARGTKEEEIPFNQNLT